MYCLKSLTADRFLVVNGWLESVLRLSSAPAARSAQQGDVGGFLSMCSRVTPSEAVERAQGVRRKQNCHQRLTRHSPTSPSTWKETMGGWTGDTDHPQSRRGSAAGGCTAAFLDGRQTAHGYQARNPRRTPCVVNGSRLQRRCWHAFFFFAFVLWSVCVVFMMTILWRQSELERTLGWNDSPLEAGCILEQFSLLGWEHQFGERFLS